MPRMNSLASALLGVALKHHGDTEDLDDVDTPEPDPREPRETTLRESGQSRPRRNAMSNAAQSTIPATQPKPAPVAVRTSRMSLASITRGKIAGPARLVVYGVDGVGKTTFAAGAPAPIFLGAEDGTRQLDVARCPSPQSWQDVLDAVRVLSQNAGGFQTFVLDTIDWTEPLLLTELCRREGVVTKLDIGGGFQKWIDAAVDEWRVLLAALEQLQASQKMNVILLAHSFQRNVKNPEGDDYERYQLKLHEKHAGLMREWAEGVYFARHEAYADKDKKTKRVRGISTGARLLFTKWTAAYDAKDRYNLPDQIALDWAEFEKARAGGLDAIEALKSEIERKAAELGGETEKLARAYVLKNASNAVQLNLLNTKLNAKIAEKLEQEPAAAVAPEAEPAPMPTTPQAGSAEPAQSVADKLFERVRAATTIEELSKLGQEIGTAKERQVITPAEREMLAAEFSERRKAVLTPAAAPANQ